MLMWLYYRWQCFSLYDSFLFAWPDVRSTSSRLFFIQEGVLESLGYPERWPIIDFSKFRFSTVSLPVLEKDISGSEWAFRGRFFGFSVLYQTLATWYLHISETFPKIWYTTTQPRKSSKRPKLRSLHFGWEFWYMVTLKKCFWNKQLELRHGKGCNRSATKKYVGYHIIYYSQVYPDLIVADIKENTGF